MEDFETVAKKCAFYRIRKLAVNAIGKSDKISLVTVLWYCGTGGTLVLWSNFWKLKSMIAVPQWFSKMNAMSILENKFSVIIRIRMQLSILNRMNTDNVSEKRNQ